MYILGLFQDEYNDFTQILNSNKDVNRKNEFAKFPNDYLLMGENAFIKFEKSLYRAIVGSKDEIDTNWVFSNAYINRIIRYLLVKIFSNEACLIFNYFTLFSGMHGERKTSLLRWYLY